MVGIYGRSFPLRLKYSLRSPVSYRIMTYRTFSKTVYFLAIVRNLIFLPSQSSITCASLMTDSIANSVNPSSISASVHTTFISD